MRAEIIRSYKTVHTWTGVITGFALFIAFYAGAITMFESTLECWISPPRSHALTPLHETARLIDAVRAARPDAAREFTVHLDDEAAPARLSWQKGYLDRLPWTAELGTDDALLIQRQPLSGIPQFIDRLHQTAGIPGEDFGRTLMGIVSLVYAVALVSGLILVLPSLLRDLFALRLQRASKRRWMDIHVLLGIAAFPFHVFIATTAVVFCLYAGINALQAPLLEQKNDNVKAADQLTGNSATHLLPPTELLRKLERIAPGFEANAIQYKDAGYGAATAQVSGTDPRYLVFRGGFVTLDATNGAVLDSDYLPGHQNVWGALVSAIAALHFGSFGGASIRWAYFFLGLSGAGVFLSGNILWIESRKAKDKTASVHTRGTRCMAAATVGVTLGAVCGISLLLAAGKWLAASHQHAAALLPGIYYGAFLACIAWAFCVGAARAARHLCLGASLATLLIPLTSLLGGAWPTSGLWLRWDSIGVDATALIASAILAFAAMKIGKRQTGRLAHSSPKQCE